MNLLFCINGGYTGPLLDCLDSIVLHGGEKHYDVYLLSSDLAEETQQQLCRQVPKAVTLHFIAVPREPVRGVPGNGALPAGDLLPAGRAPAASPGAWTVSCTWMPILWSSTHWDRCTAAILRGTYLWPAPTPGSLLTRANSHRLGLEEPVPYINTGVILMEPKRPAADDRSFSSAAVCAGAL